MQSSPGQAAPTRSSPDSTSDICIARQPILTGDQRLYAYELLFRDGLGQAFPEVDGNHATSAVMLGSYVDVGLDQIAGSSKVFVNFTAQTLVNGLAHLFQPDQLVIEILEDVSPTPVVIGKCRSLVEEGYTLALDDFEYAPEFEPLIDLATIIKVDFMLSTRPQIEDMAARFTARNIAMLAEKVETREAFEWAVDLGFTYFQGHFFSKPENIVRKAMQSSRANLLRIMSEVVRQDYDVDAVEQLISQDVGVSYKLLRYINSASLRTANRIESLRHAVLLLGTRGFRAFISLLLAGEMASDKPLELVRLACVRGKFLELACRQAAPDEDESNLFLLGMFSLLDAMLDRPMADIVSDLSLPDDIEKALAGGGGPLAAYLRLVTAYEDADWDAMTDEAKALGVYDVAQAYTQAVAWTDATLRQLRE